LVERELLVGNPLEEPFRYTPLTLSVFASACSGGLSTPALVK
jgi:hypothetical protein